MRLSTIRDFLQLEAVSGVLLILAALVALVLDNSSWAGFYQRILDMPFSIQLGHYSLAKPFLFWINEGLMSVFFLLIGLELKREFMEGELEPSKILLPGIAALGGMLLPALIYSGINYHHSAVKGWAIPVATDVAFALGVLSLFGKRVPLALKLFLMALAIFDDVGAILIIAVFHSHDLSLLSLLLAGTIVVVLIGLNKAGVRHLLPYLIAGLILWICVLKSGVHATVAGVLLAFVIPLQKKPGEEIAPLHRLEDMLHFWVAYGVMPLFAFANAGVSLQGLSWGILGSSIVIGTIAGLFLGKQLGVFSFVWVMIKLGYAKLPEHSSWLELYGIALLCGIGFTMSLFLGTLAFQNDTPIYLIEARLGVLLGSLLSSVVGIFVLAYAFTKKLNGDSSFEKK